jgi:hypothetical protein
MARRIQAGPRHDSDDGRDPDQPGSHTGLLDHLRSDSTQGLAASGGQLSARTGDSNHPTPLIVPAPLPGYQGDLMSKEWVAPNPIVN